MKITRILTVLILACFRVSFGGDIKLPPITEEVMDNGLEVVIIENHELPVVYLNAVIGAGSARDPQGKEGLANLTGGMLKKGTSSRSAVTIANDIDFVGGTLDIDIDRDDISVTTSFLTRHLDVGFGLVSEILLHPAFAPEEIDRYKRQVLNTIIQSKEDPYEVCSENFANLLFGSHPYGHPVRGSKKNLEGITPSDIMEFYDTFIRPNNTLLVISGDINPSTLLPDLSRYFGDWESKPVPVMQISTPPSPDGREILLIDKPDATQTQVIFGNFGITGDSELYFPFLVMNHALGAGVSFINRLMTEVREKGGLTYDIRTVNEFNILPGAFYCATSTENDSTLKAIETSLRIMQDVAENGITDDEYKRALGFYTGYYKTSLETPYQWAREIIKVKKYGLGTEYISNFTENINKVTRDDVTGAAKFLVKTDDLAFCVVSNAADVREDLEKLGKVTVVNLDDL